MPSDPYHYHLSTPCDFCKAQVATEFIDGRVMKCLCGTLRKDWSALKGDYRCNDRKCLMTTMQAGLFLIRHDPTHEFRISYPPQEPEPIGRCTRCKVYVDVNYIHPGWLKDDAPVRLMGAKTR